MNRRIAAAVGLLSLGLAACTSSSSNGFGGEPTDNGDEPSLVLRIEEEGGFVPVEYMFTRQPTVVWMSDGSVYMQPAMIEIYPSPIQTGYQVAKLDSSVIDDLRAAARDAGLDKDGDLPPDESGGAVADASTTVFIYVDEDGTEHRVSAYALGFMDETPERQALMEMRDKATDLASFNGGADVDMDIQPADRIRIGVKAYTPIEDLPQEDQEWPLGDLASFGEAADDQTIVERCGILKGADVATFVEAAQGANIATPWVSGGQRFSILVDPLTPDETATCN